jgi:hypothetical protein
LGRWTLSTGRGIARRAFVGALPVSAGSGCAPRPLLGRMNASVRFIVWGSIPVGAFVGALIGGRYGALTALWVSVAGQLVAVPPVLLSPLRRMRDLPRALDQHADSSS